MFQFLPLALRISRRRFVPAFGAIWLFAALLFATGCHTAQKTVGSVTKPTVTTADTKKNDDNIIEATIVQLNDVYEIATLENGKVGGLARVAAVCKKLKAENPNTVVVMAGDFFNPSCLGTMKVNGKRVSGAQMVETLNAMGLDIAIFGNHEFDLKESEVQERLDEGRYGWVSTNVRHVVGDVVAPFRVRDTLMPESRVLAFGNKAGKVFRMGVLGLTINSNKAKYVLYTDAVKSAAEQAERLRPRCEAMIAITHLSIAEDRLVAAAVPTLSLIIGGHEHAHHFEKVGEVPIAKADANAKTIYIHRLRYDIAQKHLSIVSELKSIDDTQPEDPATAAIVAKWTAKAETNFAAQGFQIHNKVCDLKAPLDGRDEFTRTQPAPLGKRIATAMLEAWRSEKPDCALFNAGSIRIDDVVSSTITEWDVIRMLPFGGAVPLIEIRGDVLRRTLEVGWKSAGSGGFLQWSGIERSTDGSLWTINEQALDDNRTYRVAIADFLLSGASSDLPFLKDNPAIKLISTPATLIGIRADVRLALIAYLRG